MDCSDICVEEVRQVLSMVPDDGKLATLTRTEFEQVVSVAFMCGQMAMALLVLSGDEYSVELGAIACTMFQNEVNSMLGLFNHYVHECRPDKWNAGGCND